MSERLQRDWHYLRHMTCTNSPSNLLFVDTETKHIKDPDNHRKEHHKLWFWCGYSCRFEKTGITREEIYSNETKEMFWEIVRARADNKRPLWIFTHNAGFDMTVLGLWRMILDKQIEFVQVNPDSPVDENGYPVYDWMGFAVLDDPPTIIKFRFTGTTKTVIVIDTMNYFRRSLEFIGESIKMPKMRKPDLFESLDTWIEYCHNDVKVLAKAVIALIRVVQNQELGKFGYTISSISFNAYRSRFIPDGKQILIHGNREVIDKEREAYHGGACQCWYKGSVVDCQEYATTERHNPPSMLRLHGKVYAMDCQSFYPAMMAMHKYPNKLRCIVPECTYQEMKDLNNAFSVIATVQLDCRGHGFPYTEKGKTYYATGRFVTTLCGPELARAIREDCIAACWDLCVYDNADLFTQFVMHFWNERKKYQKKGNDAFAYVCKLILNSLYGKFGQHKPRWQQDNTVYAPIPLGHWWSKKVGCTEREIYRSLGYLPQKMIGKTEHSHSFPAIPAFVTSYGREYILSLVNAADVTNCLYSDTDSLHVLQAGYDNLDRKGLIRPDVLGHLQLEKTYESVEYRGPKNYTADGVDIIAGIKKKAEKVRRGQYTQPKFQRITSVLAGKQLDSIAVDYVSVALREWYPMGHIDCNGRVYPPCLSKW